MKARLRTIATIVLCFSFTLSFGQQTPVPTSTPKVEPQQAQQPVPQPSPSPSKEPAVDVDDVVKITTNLVQMDAVVTDKKGKRVTDLRPEEVEILEDGRSQKITNFSYVETEAPKTVKATPVRNTDPLAPPTVPEKPRFENIKRTIALVVDDIGLSFESAYLVRRALKKYVDEQVQEGDLVAIIRTAGGVGALQQFTTDRRMLYSAVEKVKWSPQGLGRISAVPPINLAPDLAEGESDDQSADSNLDELREDVFTSGTLGTVKYVAKGMEGLPGRKSLVLFSDGLTISTKNSETNFRIITALRSLIDQANRSSVVVYTLDARGLQVLGLTAADTGDPRKLFEANTERRWAFFDSQQGLDFLAANTGGFSIKNNNDINGALKRVVDDQQGYYLIGYRPDDTFDTVNGRTKYHRLELKIKRKGDYRVRMRNGFYGITDEKKAAIAQTPQQQIRDALGSPFGSADVQLKLTSIFSNNETGSFVHSYLHVKASDLTFTTEADGSHKTSIDIIVITFGDNGMVLDQTGATQQIVVKDESFKKFLTNGFVYNIRLPVKKAGGYQLRTAVRDKTSTRIGTASQFIEVPDVKKGRLLMSGLLLRGIPVDAYMKFINSKGSNEAIEQADPNANPAVRQFNNGLALIYGFSIFNAKLDKTTRKPQLKTQVRIFRNGEQLFVGDEVAFDPGDQTDTKRFQVAGAIQLGTKMTPGEYIIQMVTTDMLAPEKKRMTSQWMSFDITK